MRTVFDPLRRKEVSLTPEEQVRQWCIGVLADSCKVPLHMMMSEASIHLGAKTYRVDIIVYDRQVRPLMVVECKRPEVPLDRAVLDQAIRYNMVLNVKYIMITNGNSTCLCRRTENDGKVQYVIAESVPEYDEMICQPL